MEMLIASPYGQQLYQNAEYTNEPPNTWPDADWVVCYGYRHIIPSGTLRRFGGRIINIHISFLPHNRGSDPNFWSWVDNTPKGVSIHQIDDGIDTGPIYSQVRASMNPHEHTLRSSYELLHRLAQSHFASIWPSIKSGALVPTNQFVYAGTYHRSADKNVIFNQLSQGWDTPVTELFVPR